MPGRLVGPPALVGGADGPQAVTATTQPVRMAMTTERWGTDTSGGRPGERHGRRRYREAGRGGGEAPIVAARAPIVLIRCSCRLTGGPLQGAAGRLQASTTDLACVIVELPGVLVGLDQGQLLLHVPKDDRGV